MEAPNQFPYQASYQTSYQPPNHNTAYPNHVPYQGPDQVPYQGPDQGSYQGPDQVSYQGPDQAPYQHQNYAPNYAPNQPVPNPPQLRQKYYKPIATRRPILSLFFLSSLIFIAGLEYVLRRSIPVPAEVSLKGGTVRPRMLREATSTYSSNWTSYENTPSSTTPTMQIPSCIGVEIIISVTPVERCSTTIPESAASCVTTTGQSTYQKPIFNTPLPTMPCYICAMQQQGIDTSEWITVTTTHCASCDPQSPATVYPCSTCPGTVLTETPLWETTPTWSAKPYTTYAEHTN